MNGKSRALFFVCLFCAGVMIVPFIASCGKGAAAAASSGIQFQVINLSPDLQPVNLFANDIQQNIAAFAYPSPSGYFSLNDITPPIQIRSANAYISVANLITISTPLQRNFKYTMYMVGRRADSTVTGLFVTDTAAAPTPGSGKIRFINASPGSSPLDITANDTAIFKAQAFKSITSFIEIPPGNYIFKVIPTGQTAPISTTATTTIVDGKVYTLYCYGISGGADSVAFNTGIINNR